MAGKARSKLNATKHGERSAKSRTAWRELNAALRALDQHDRDRADMLDGMTAAGIMIPGETWVQRIADELSLSDLSVDLICARFSGSAEEPVARNRSDDSD